MFSWGKYDIAGRGGGQTGRASARPVFRVGDSVDEGGLDTDARCGQGAVGRRHFHDRHLVGAESDARVGTKVTFDG